MKPRRTFDDEPDDHTPEDSADVLADFCALLIDSLQVPEVVSALAAALDDAASTPLPDRYYRSSPPGRSQLHRRGHR